MQVGKEWERTGKPRFFFGGCNWKRASTYVFAERLSRNPEVRGSTPLCSSDSLPQVLLPSKDGTKMVARCGDTKPAEVIPTAAGSSGTIRSGRTCGKEKCGTPVGMRRIGEPRLDRVIYTY
jgi:hypothetical protein